LNHGLRIHAQLWSAEQCAGAKSATIMPAMPSDSRNCGLAIDE